MNIIAVDDEPLALKSIARAINEEYPDIEPALFDTPVEALDYAGENNVNVAFLDIEMAGMSGLTLAKQLKDINGRTNIIFVTGYSQYALDAHTLYPVGYLMKPITTTALRKAMENLRYPIVYKTDMRVRVQTFGNFEVFVDNKPLYFPRSKSKEIFAFLVSKNGTSCTIQELAAELFKDGTSANSVRVYIAAMIKTLEDAEIGNVVVKGFNSIGVNPNTFDCDLYRFHKMDPEAVNAYMGEFMAQYSWAEFTTGYLDSKSL